MTKINIKKIDWLRRAAEMKIDNSIRQLKKAIRTQCGNKIIISNIDLGIDNDHESNDWENEIEINTTIQLKFNSNILS